MSRVSDSALEVPIADETPSSQRRTILVYIPCALLVIFGLGMVILEVALLAMSLSAPLMMDFPVTLYALTAIGCGFNGGLAWIASGILFDTRRWGLFLLLMGYGLMAFSHSVTSPAVN